MKIEKVTIGKRVRFITARNSENIRAGLVSAINQTKTGPFVEVTMKDGSKVQTRAGHIL